MIIIYIDGSTLGNGTKTSKGGFGVVVYQNNKLINAYQHFENGTTNNEQELKAILWAMINYGKDKEIPIVYSDSAYSVNSLNTWIYSWQRNGWRKADKQIPKNLDLIQAYWELLNKGYKINLQKVKGHSDIKGNELADALATEKKQVKDLI